MYHPVAMTDVNTQDSEQLRLLGIFHFVLAGITCLFAMFPIIHLLVGIAIVSGALGATGEDQAPELLGWIFVWFAGVWIVMGIAFAITVAVAGRFLLKRRHHTFCLVIAGLSCLFMPIGTVLGVFTIIVLMRDSVRKQFGLRSSPAE